ncbi:sensor histidine kinase [Enterococcus raffinosus]|uniref:sensor histidine kinase n=1 Tax=Enterococcus raffinosus TaxID=71452 RepID=UPI001C11227D|nr:sensor histidine kinase [Enterococcus raffinosus]MBU5360284.1 sensor histidine kinase [Enterococcus raffinosus]
MKRISIGNTLDYHYKLVILLAILPMVLISIFFMVNIFQYRQSIENVNDVNKMNSEMSTKIDNSVFYLITGKPTRMQDPTELIVHYQKELDKLKDSSPSFDQQQTLDIAKRILDTDRHYVNTIKENIAAEKPISDSEAILVEIRNVNVLLKDTLQEFVTGEINLSNKKSNQIFQTIIILIFLEICLVVILVIIITRNKKNLNARIKVPMDKLLTSLSEVSKGNLDTQVESSEIVEFDILSSEVNQMTTQIKALLEQNDRKQQAIAKAELRALQAQITPHFIYNSLDAIITLSELDEPERVIETTLALSNFFKLTLNNGNDWVTVKQEIEHVTSYLQILKTRYGSILEYQITIDPKIEHVKMLKMILQPIVENAMYHGIKHSRQRGVIHINGRQQGESLIFEVTDNGVGMTTQQIETLQKNIRELDPTGVTGGYGLYNIYRRLRLYFGETAELKIDSQENQGTTVTIILPLKTDVFVEKRDENA